MKFRKYEFNSKEEYENLKIQTNVSSVDGTFVELGCLREDKYSVDVLWNQQSPEEFIQYEIWDVEGNGSHTFLGWDFNPDE
jgi:hypothetical protein